MAKISFHSRDSLPDELRDTASRYIMLAHELDGMMLRIKELISVHTNWTSSDEINEINRIEQELTHCEVIKNDLSVIGNRLNAFASEIECVESELASSISSYF